MGLIKLLFGLIWFLRTSSRKQQEQEMSWNTQTDEEKRIKKKKKPTKNKAVTEGELTIQKNNNTILLGMSDFPWQGIFYRRQ